MVLPRSTHQRWHISVVSKSTLALAVVDQKDSAPIKVKVISKLISPDKGVPYLLGHIKAEMH